MFQAKKRAELVNDQKISAVYFGLLQSGYEFYSAGKDPKQVHLWETWRGMPSNCDLAFFENTKQLTTGIYPYMPRSAALEAACFHLDPKEMCFVDLNAYHDFLLSMDKLKDLDTNHDFRTWIRGFPKALSSVMICQGFLLYNKWEEEFIKQQSQAYRQEMKQLDDLAAYFVKQYDFPVKKITIILCPLKCSFIANFFLMGDVLYAVLGEFKLETVMHEYLRLLLHPLVRSNSTAILAMKNLRNLNMDESYFIEWNAAAMLNVFEEYAIRQLTDEILDGYYKIDLEDEIASFIKMG